MKINGLDTAPRLAFGRAFTSAEERRWADIVTQSKQALGLDKGDTFVIAFDSMMPEAEGKDKGIGSSFSQSSSELTDFAARKFGITGVQYSPQGRLDGMTASPFSTTAFALGEHLTDLKQLTTKEFEGILPAAAYKEALLPNNTDTVDYSRILPKDNPTNTALGVAFKNFQNLPETSPLRGEYNTFLKENGDWVEKEALYDCLEAENGGKYWKEWDSAFDRDLFSGTLTKDKQNRIQEIKQNNKEIFEKTLFTQFILDKQQQATKAAYNQKGQKLVGDCLIGFSAKEHWANRDAFKDDEYLGAADPRNESQEELKRCCWGTPALDVDKMGTANKLSIAGKLLERKLELNFKRYDGIRIDAAWQLINPFTYIVDKKTGDVRKNPNNGTRQLGDSVLQIIDKTLKKTRPNDYKTYPVNLELLGGPVRYYDAALKGRTQIQHSIYQHEKWGSVNFYKTEVFDKQTGKKISDGLSENEMAFGLGTHDDWTLLQIANGDKSATESGVTVEKQAPVLAKNLKLDQYKLLNDKTEFAAAKFAEIFTTKNNFFTLFDAMGINKRINTQNNKDKENWGARIPLNYEEVYHKNLTEGKGLNLADAYLKAMHAKNINNPGLTRSLEQAKRILMDGTNGIYTQKDADKVLGKNTNKLG